MIRMYTDAAVNGYPGQAGVGLLILLEKEQKQFKVPLEGLWNNHHAEFKAMLLGLEWLVENNHTDQMVFAFTDSKIVAHSVTKKYVKNQVSNQYLTKILNLMAHFPFASIEWIPSSDNQGADNLARQALYKVAKKG